MRRTTVLAGMIVLLGTFLRAQAGAAEEATAEPYSGDFFTRPTLTGDWVGLRNAAAAKGVTFDISLTQVGQGVVDGGKGLIPGRTLDQFGVGYDYLDIESPTYQRPLAGTRS